MKKILWIVIAILTILNVVQYYVIYDFRQMTPYYSSDKEIIELAINDYVKEARATRNEVMKGRFPMVMGFGEARCVSLRVRDGWVGVSPVLCYDQEQNRVQMELRD